MTSAGASRNLKLWLEERRVGELREQGNPWGACLRPGMTHGQLPPVSRVAIQRGRDRRWQKPAHGAVVFRQLAA